LFVHSGSNVSVIAPKEAGAGKIEIQIDGKTRATSRFVDRWITSGTASGVRNIWSELQASMKSALSIVVRGQWQSMQ